MTLTSDDHNSTIQSSPIVTALHRASNPQPQDVVDQGQHEGRRDQAADDDADNDALGFDRHHDGKVSTSNSRSLLALRAQQALLWSEKRL